MDLKRALQEEPANKDVRALFKRYKQQVRGHMDGVLVMVRSKA